MGLKCKKKGRKCGMEKMTDKEGEGKCDVSPRETK